MNTIKGALQTPGANGNPMMRKLNYTTAALKFATQVLSIFAE